MEIFRLTKSEKDIAENLNVRVRGLCYALQGFVSWIGARAYRMSLPTWGTLKEERYMQGRQ